MQIKDVGQVAEWRLCVGCGACAYACPDDNIKLVDIINDGIRPILSSNNCKYCHECIKVCPGLEMVHYCSNGKKGFVNELEKGWGPILEMWEGYAVDNEIRVNGSSGGLATAIALYCIERERMYGVLHTGYDKEQSYKNQTVFSRTRSDLISVTGSRYSPASPCDGLVQIKSAPDPCVFIGKPCDVAGLRKTQAIKPELDNKVGIAIGIFCAGTPSTRGTLDLLHSLNVNPDKVAEIRYRGKGWPGMFTVHGHENKHPLQELKYTEAWGFLNNYRPFRCYICPDGTSEFADIACGDPWYREIGAGEEGYSLVLVRTEKGREILRGAMKSGYVTLNNVGPEILLKSQENLFAKRGTIWGRLITMRALGIPTPRYSGFRLFQNWLSISLKEKLRSVLGTVRRIIQRRYYRPSVSNKQASYKSEN